MAPSTRQLGPCSSCKIIIKSNQKVIFCDGECKKVFHQTCTELSAKECVDLMSSDNDFWICKFCKQKRLSMRKSISATATTTTTPTPTTAKEFFTGDEPTLTTINQKINKLLDNQEYLTYEVNNLKIIIEDYKKITNEIIQCNLKLQQENEILKNDINKVQYKFDNLEQKTRENNLIINGVEKTSDENLIEAVLEITQTLDVEIDQNDIIDVYRMENKENLSGLPSPIMFKVKNKDIVSKILKNKKGKKLNTNMLPSKKYESRPIYINEDLIKQRQFLYKKARDARKGKKIEFAWVKDGEIFIRKNSESRIIVLKHINQLNNA